MKVSHIYCSRPVQRAGFGVRQPGCRFSLVGFAFLDGLLPQSSKATLFSAFPQRSQRLRVIFFPFLSLATRHSPLLSSAENPVS
jgi:hypothetical protein